ncbi:hypothetical protein [Burkholderia territorii]|uniref:hypothetical protein n=1 Tax=Burkholderia territorii TaxID=1503055 RepID=UPI000A9434BD
MSRLPPITLAARFAANAGDSRLFHGEAGNRDHARATPPLAARVAAAHPRHIDADEPLALPAVRDYKTPAQRAAYYARDACRSPDHDTRDQRLGTGRQCRVRRRRHKPCSTKKWTASAIASATPVQRHYLPDASSDAIFTGLSRRPTARYVVSTEVRNFFNRRRAPSRGAFRETCRRIENLSRNSID